MGLVYGRMNYNSTPSRSVSGDHDSCNPSKAKPKCHSEMIGRSSSDVVELEHDSSNLPMVRVTRQVSRLMAEQAIRRSSRLRSASRGLGHDTSSGSLPSTLRRSARIAGVGIRPNVSGVSHNGRNLRTTSRSASSLSSVGRSTMNSTTGRPSLAGAGFTETRIRRSSRLRTQRRSH